MSQIATRTTNNSIQLRTVSDAFRAGKDELMVQNIKERIMQAAVYRGIRLTGEDALVAARSYLDDLRKYFPGIALEEVTEIIQDGVRKEYGDYFGINAGTLYDWTCAYMRSPKREAYVRAAREREYKGRMLARKTEVSQEEMDNNIIAAIEKSYAAFRKMMKRTEPVETPEGSVRASVLMKAFPVRYPIGHPLCDLGHFRETWLHDHGFTGSLKEIFETAIADDRDFIVRRVER